MVIYTVSLFNMTVFGEHVSNLSLFASENRERTQGSGVACEVLFELAEELFSNASGETWLITGYNSWLKFEPFCYLPNIRVSHSLKELTFLHGAVISLCIMHLSQIPRQMCILSIFFHGTSGDIRILTPRIIATHHPQLSHAIKKYTTKNDFSAVRPICIPYMGINVSSSQLYLLGRLCWLQFQAAQAWPMSNTLEKWKNFSEAILLEYNCGQHYNADNEEATAFRQGLSLGCSNGFSFLKVRASIDIIHANSHLYDQAVQSF